MDSYMDYPEDDSLESAQANQQENEGQQSEEESPWFALAKEICIPRPMIKSLSKCHAILDSRAYSAAKAAMIFRRNYLLKEAQREPAESRQAMELIQCASELEQAIEQFSACRVEAA